MLHYKFFEFGCQRESFLECLLHLFHEGLFSEMISVV
ncbi:predicted protein [Botrytis cinerea T4]|uniref:Uncharacterized protein n=1 Tax=Botryotinia fuckeliana (strain T4) TaxID=999810 RepID=G2XPV0_BOTF4|nr:predicted protein [Botrytis cinerea T4]